METIAEPVRAEVPLLLSADVSRSQVNQHRCLHQLISKTVAQCPSENTTKTFFTL